MRFSATLVPFLSILFVVASPLPGYDPVTLAKGEIPPAVYDTLVFYFKYASSAYIDICARPNGNTFVSKINDLVTDTQGYIARDDGNKEIVVALRGTSSLTDVLIDVNLIQTPYISAGVSAPAGTRVHGGFLAAWNSVASSVISIVRAQLADHPDYSIVTSGHSLGGSLSSLAGISLKENFPGADVRIFTYGQPRTGNDQYVTWVNDRLGSSKLFRAVHTSDWVPSVLPRSSGYRHHGVEYWTYIDPSSATTTRQCAPDGEDPTCSASIPFTGINGAHVVYFNIPASTPFCM